MSKEFMEKDTGQMAEEDVQKASRKERKKDRKQKRADMEEKAKLLRVAFFNSMRFRILLCVMFTSLVLGIVNLIIVIPKLTKEVTSTMTNYIYGLTESVGHEVENFVLSNGLTYATINMDVVAESVKLRGIDSSYCYVVSRDGVILYHPQEEKIGQPVENAVIEAVVEEMARTGEVPETKVVTYDFNGTGKYAAYCVGQRSRLITVISADSREVTSSVRSITIEAIIGSVLVIVICIVLSSFYIFKMLQPMNTIVSEVGKLAYMDFTESGKQQKLSRKKDEIGVMSRAIDGLRSELIQVVRDLRQQSELLYETSEQMSSKARDTAAAIDQVDSAVHDIAEGATSQASETQSATEDIMMIGNLIEENNSNVAGIRQSSDEIQGTAMVANDTLNQLQRINVQVKDAIDQIYEQTHTTNESATKIQEAAALITNIAEETNLLSLNASIEAARAGEYGKGFAVVANQIQKLAEQSNESANRIEGIITDLMADSERSVETMEEVRRVVEEQNESVRKTGDIFKTVQNGIHDSMDGIEQISTGTDKMAKARASVTDVVQNLTAIAQENAASTQETSAAVTQVRNSVDDISSHADGLNDIATTLEETMKKFQI